MDFDELWNLNISQIWNLTDQNDFIIAMNGWLCRKSDYGQNMDTLTPEEQVFHICTSLEGEVNNGGFSQYLYNSSGDNAYRVVDCLKMIGAFRTAEICADAFAAYGRPIPRNRDERGDFLDEFETEEVAEILDECDARFYAYEDDLEHLNYLYIHAHKDSFC